MLPIIRIGEKALPKVKRVKRRQSKNNLTESKKERERRQKKEEQAPYEWYDDYFLY